MIYRPDNYPEALEHGDFSELFPDIFFVSGKMKVSKPSMSFSRNMVVVRERGNLTLVNSLRLTEPGLSKLQKLGEIRNVIRLAGFHGRDDAFYKDRFGATVYAVRGQRYVRGFDQQATAYFEADEYIDDGSDLPIADARLHTLRGARTPEAVLLMLREGGILVTGDSLQNWAEPDRYFSLAARLIMRLMGYIGGHQVGPGWLKLARPSAEDLEALLELRFQHVLPVHGEETIGNAREAYRPYIEKASRNIRSAA